MPSGLIARPTRRLVTAIAASANSAPTRAWSRASFQTSSISSPGSATRISDSMPPFFIAIGMTAVSAGALTSARNQRGAADSSFASLTIEEASDGSPTPARTCRRCCRLATSALTSPRSGASGDRASEVATKSLVSRIALCVSTRVRSLACKSTWTASTASQSANSDAKIRLIRLPREIERHIRRRLFYPSPLILPGGLSMVARRPALSPCRAGQVRRVGARQGVQRLRVLIIDDHPIIVSGCRALLEGEGDIEVVEAQDGAAGYAAYFDLKPDVAIIDINLPGFSGLELLRRIIERAPDARLIVFSMNDDPIVAARAIEAGAKGYIAKNDDPALFAGAVKLVANGGRYLHPEMARRIAFLRADPSPD